MDTQAFFILLFSYLAGATLNDHEIKSVYLVIQLNAAQKIKQRG